MLLFISDQHSTARRAHILLVCSLPLSGCCDWERWEHCDKHLLEALWANTMGRWELLSPRELCNSFEEHGLCFKSQGLGLSPQPPLPELCRAGLGAGPYRTCTFNVGGRLVASISTILLALRMSSSSFRNFKRSSSTRLTCKKRKGTEDSGEPGSTGAESMFTLRR